MSDFYQNGVVTTLHRLNMNDVARLERELLRFSQNMPIGLVLPSLFSEFETPAMQRILTQLRQVSYLRRVVLVLAKANRKQYVEVNAMLKQLPQRVTLIWIDSERIQRLFQLLEDRGLSAGQDGKGRSCWLSYGYLLATGDCDVIALHDCDILNYDRQLLARLCYPVANPNLGFEFCKGYYARVTDRMHGRVTRLFMSPLIWALKSMSPGVPFLKFLDSFRYVLAGEFAMKTNLARMNRIPGDWGLEVGVLAEIYRNCAVSQTCQVDLADNYEHKHQVLSEDDDTRGLRRMATDIAKSLFRTLAAEGVPFVQGHFRSLGVRYVRMAEDTVARHYADAMLNGLGFDRHSEELAVTTFAKSLQQAAEEFAEDPFGQPLIPNWNRVIAAIPEFFELLVNAIEEDALFASGTAA